MPEYVKTANILTAEAAVGIDSNSFADSQHRKFALNTKANCWCSALYSYGNQCNNKAECKQTEANLASAANIWGINSDIARIKQAFSTQAVEVTYALSFTHKGTVVNRCPDHTKAAATASAQWLFDNRFNFPVTTQKQAAARLYAKVDAVKLGHSAANYLDRLVNPDCYSTLNTKIALAITDRLHAVPTTKWTELEDTLLKFANSLNAAPFEICQEPSIIATALENLDVKHGFTAKWGSSFQHPVDVCFRANLTKVAAAVDSTIHLVTGTPVDLNKISDFQLEKGLKIAGDDFLAYCQTDGLNVDRNKAAEILPTLPKPEAHRFEAAIKKAGYNPETAYTLMDRLFDKESQGPAGPPMPGPAPEPNPYALQQGENDANHGNRLQGMQQAADAARAQADSLNEDADQADLDIEAAQAQAEADQHRRARIVNPQLPMQPELKQAAAEPAVGCTNPDCDCLNCTNPNCGK